LISLKAFTDAVSVIAPVAVNAAGVETETDVFAESPLSDAVAFNVKLDNAVDDEIEIVSPICNVYDPLESATAWPLSETVAPAGRPDSVKDKALFASASVGVGAVKEYSKTGFPLDKVKSSDTVGALNEGAGSGIFIVTVCEGVVYPL